MSGSNGSPVTPVVHVTDAEFAEWEREREENARREREQSTAERARRHAAWARANAAPPWPGSLAPAAMHGPLGEFVAAITPHTEADPPAILVQLLAAFGNAAGRGARHRGPDYTARTNLYVVIVGKSAVARKGSSWTRARQIMRHAAPSWAEHNVTGGLSSAEGLIWAVRDPVVKRREASPDDWEEADADGIIEELVEDGIADKRLMVVESEFAAVLRQGKRDGNNLSAILRQFWDGGDVRTLTKNSPAKTTGAHVSLVGHITADELRRELGQSDVANGFANRFLWVCSRKSRSLPFGGTLSDDDLAELAEPIRVALERARELDTEVPWAQDSRPIWASVYDQFDDLPESGALAHVMSRGGGQVAKLAMIYALADGSATICPEHLHAALAVWDYCVASVRFIWGDRSDDPLAEKIRDALLAEPNGLARGEIRKLVGGRIDEPRLQAALHTLERAGRARMEKRSTGGRPQERWFADLRSTLSSTDDTALVLG